VSEITEVRGWIDRRVKLPQFRWYCLAGRHWDRNNWDDNPNNVMRCAPRCFADGHIKLIPIGDMPDDVCACFKRKLPPPGSPPDWDRGHVIDDVWIRKHLKQYGSFMMKAGARGKSNDMPWAASAALSQIEAPYLMLKAYKALLKVKEDRYVAEVRLFDLYRITEDILEFGLSAEESATGLFPRWPGPT
jgi:hypothetical protein